ERRQLPQEPADEEVSADAAKKISRNLTPSGVGRTSRAARRSTVIRPRFSSEPKHRGGLLSRPRLRSPAGLRSRGCEDPAHREVRDLLRDLRLGEAAVLPEPARQP